MNIGKTRKGKGVKALAFLAFFSAPLMFFNLCYAEYCATGPIEAYICSGFVIESCEYKTVDAVEGEDGQLYEPARCYSSVSEYNEKLNICHIRLKGKYGVFNFFTSTMIPNFYHKLKSGAYEKIEPDALKFKCIKTNK